MVLSMKRHLPDPIYRRSSRVDGALTRTVAAIIRRTLSGLSRSSEDGWA
jgi:hypothetical protein